MKQLDHLLRLLKLQSRFEKVKGFSSALHLGYEDILADPSRISFPADDRISVRMNLQDSLLLKGQIGISTYMAMIDDVTTWALMCANQDRPRPGVSLNLRGNWASSARPQQVDIIAEVTKIGKNIGFVDAKLIDPTDNSLIFAGSHIKYLASLGLAGEILTSPYGRGLADLYVNQIATAAGGEVKSLQDLFSGIKFVTPTKATFTAGREHASLGAPIHGGCQGILMEQVALRYAKEKQNIDATSLKSLNIDFMSSTGPKIEIQVEELVPAIENGDLTLIVKLLSRSRLTSQAVAVIRTNEHNSKL